VFSNFPAELNYSLRNPGHLLPLSPSVRVPRIPPAPPALGTRFINCIFFYCKNMVG
jgi:hypothetical protein